ncbi:HEAT repeat domain-containing protein [Oceanidesulfovibrio indonesiensis]|uniref:HEAT repeat domain-containing protein n=1 Tax=Oceanidesulfovibrio indonesiensis TaxID=54767 RepID=A0A7M3MJE2_9BACT|nr:HEAT repeat domain-containing protein [Oceanidesulfovibrio indonesiensis]TVM19895.1 HEAT repeat domain-containing protein [Oceanidesulfovibrio indonesiensis]
MAAKEAVLKLLSSDDPHDIREGAFTAGDERMAEAVEPLVLHLQSGSLGVQEAADAALRQIGGEKAVAALIPLLRSDDVPVRNLAMDILREIGKQDVDTLIELLRDEDPDMRIFASDILGETRNPLVVGPLCRALLKDPEVNVRYQAAVSLGTVASEEAAGCLNKALEDEEWVQFAVIEALTKIRDESSINALAKAMSRSTDLVSSMIIDALGEMGNIKAVALLLKRLEASPTALRNKIVKAVVNILGGKSLSLLSQDERENLRVYALIALEDEDEEIQDAAIQGLAYVGGEKASAAILKLAAKLDPVSNQDRIESMAAALASIGNTKALEAALSGDEWKKGMVALEAYRRIGDPQFAGHLQEAFPHKDLDMQRAITTVLREIADDGATDFFLGVLEEQEDGDVLKDAAEFLGLKVKAPQALPLLFRLLDHPFDDVKDMALEAIIAINGPEVRQRFKELFDSEEPLDRLMATYALGRLGHEDDLNDLQRALEDPVPEIRKIALESLDDMCFELDRLLPLTIGCLSDEEREVRLAVVEILGKCHDDAVLPYLEQALGDEDDWVRIRALEALGERRATQTIPKIVPLLESDNTLILLKVIEALGDIGGENAFRSLFTVLDNENSEVQAAAEEALAKLKAERE